LSERRAGRGVGAGDFCRCCCAGDRNIGADGKLEIDRVEEMDAIGIHKPNIGRGDLSAKGLDLSRPFQQRSSIQHIGDVKLFDHLLVFDGHVLLILIKIEQFLP
jgi:hypothetical protein